MRIILLSSGAMTGKTSTFHEIYKCLTQGMSPPPIKAFWKKTNDFECEFTYKKQTVALYSSGDTILSKKAPCIIEAIIKYSHVDCLVLAHRTGGPERTRIANIVNACQQHKVFPKTVVSNGGKAAEDAANRNDAQAIVKLI